jgi:NAD-dependent dihydropyrimidine dehydrogenase PreA subunit
MSDWRNIPREKIPWYPTVDAEKCTGCRTCVEFCENGVLEFDEQALEAKVRSPFSCVVECSTCGRLCPSSAISFPDQKEFTDIIRKLIEEYRQ